MNNTAAVGATMVLLLAAGCSSVPGVTDGASTPEQTEVFANPAPSTPPLPDTLHARTHNARTLHARVNGRRFTHADRQRRTAGFGWRWRDRCQRNPTPLFEGGEGVLGPPLRVLAIAPDQLIRSSGSWSLGRSVDIEQAPSYEVAEFDAVREPQWHAVCLSYEDGPRFCEPVMLDAGVAFVDVAGDGLSAAICRDGSVVEMADLPQAPAPICAGG